jgi:hypothetical protein
VARSDNIVYCDIRIKRNIMKLTGKALSEFNQWLYTNYPDNLINENCGYSYGTFERDLEQLTYILPELMNNALIVEWFDSVGLWKDNFYYCYRATKFLDYKEAIKQAITKANQIYNNE